MAAKPIIIVPPGGFQGFAEQTIATQALLGSKAGRRTRPRRKKAKKKSKRVARRKPASATKRKSPRRKSGRLKKGSPEARRRMAQLRKMRKKK